MNEKRFKIKSLNSWALQQGLELGRQYGLLEIVGPADIYNVWSVVSHESGVSWLEPTHELVQEVFEVELEEIQSAKIVGKIE